MKKKRDINLDTEKGRNEILKALASFRTKGEAYAYLGVSGNSNGIQYLKNVADAVGFDLDFYGVKRKPIKCKECGNVFTPKYKRIFCSSSCAAKYNNRKRGKTTKGVKEKISNGLIKYYSTQPHKDEEHRTLMGKKIRIIPSKCPICGSRECGRRGICKRTKAFFSSLSHFGFDMGKLGTTDVFKEYEKVKTLLLTEYFENRLSPKDLKEKYEYPKTYENITHLLKSMDFNTRNLSESQINAFLVGKTTLPTVEENKGLYFHSGYHTTWQGETIFYRSGSELKYAMELDKQNIPYKVEDLRIEYYDTIKGCERVAIPDFHLTAANEIVEVKSRITFNKQNMIDKFKKYEELGYSSKLLYEGKMYSKEEINTIEEYGFLI